MSSLALEDLLSSKSVDSLKLSIEQFHSTANEKKKELQGMVGSEYHLFVKSAKDVSNIREKTEIVIKRLHNLSTKKISISKSFDKLQHLTGYSSFGRNSANNGGNAVISSNASQLVHDGTDFSIDELESSVWDLINFCDFNAATDMVQRNSKQRNWYEDVSSDDWHK
jgi:hypothetical protein